MVIFFLFQADCYAVCVELHNVPCTDFNQTSENFLKYVVTHESELNLVRV